MTWFDEIARWYLVSLGAGLCAAPFTAWLFRRLPGHGAWFARPVGLIAVIWPIWFLSSISPVPYRDLTLVLSALALAVLSWGLAARSRTISRDWIGPYLAAEGIFLVAFLGYLWFRGYVPKIAGTEKPMDEAFLSSTIRVTDMPPADPWMAGETINYYYLGYLINGSIARVAGLPGWIAFNLALASVFAMSVTAAAGLAWSVVRTTFGQRLAIVAGTAAAFLVMIAGNMRAPIEYLKDSDHTWTAFWYQNIGWQSSRVIVDHGGTPNDGETIQEFPSFSFVLGDLHPHVLTLPFTIVALALAVCLFRRVHADWDPFAWRSWTEFGAIGVILGSLYPMNSWDFPTYGVAIAVALLLSTGPIWDWVQQMAVLGVVAIASWSPFWVSFVPFSGPGDQDITSIPGLHFIAKNVAGYTGERTSAGEYLTVWGLTWTVAMVFLVVETIATWPPRVDDPERSVQPPYVRGAMVAAIVVFVMLALALPAPVLILAGLPVALAARLIWVRIDGERDLTMLVSVLYAAGWGITILTEFFYIQDVFNGRFNTLFKIYYQVWTLVGIAGAIAIILLWQRAVASAPSRALIGAGLAVALAAGLVYPVVSIKTWFDYLNPSRNWIGVDGLAPHGTEAFMPDPSNPDRNTGKSRDDVAAIRWLNDHAQPGDVLLEAPGCGYEINGELPTGRFSAFTGIPTVIGWDGHEGQWRGGQPELLNDIVPRAGDVSSMFEDPDPVNNPLFDEYGITLLVVGDLEKYGAGLDGRGLPACEIAGPYQSITVDGYPGPGWELVYDGATKIYRRASE
jgi:YYY domain-containing protein